MNSKTTLKEKNANNYLTHTTSNKGITLIALIITIIVMLILVAVTINMAIKGGLFGNAGKAVGETKNAIKEELDWFGIYEDKIEDIVGDGIWRISLNTYNPSPNLKIKLRSKFYNVIPDTLKEYKEIYLLKVLDADAEYESLDAWCAASVGKNSMDEVIELLEQQTGQKYTRDEVIYGLRFGTQNEDEALSKVGYSTENIEEIEREYEKKKNSQSIPERYLNKTYIVTYPDGTEETVSGADLTTYIGEYSVNENNKDYHIKIVENEEEKILSINVKNFVKYLTYEDDYYTYEFNTADKGYKVSTKDKTLSQYGKILENIDGINIVSLCDTFKNCTNLIQAPEIPNGVTDMMYTFYNCTNLIQAPKIPQSVTNMNSTFSYCKSITQAPEIPDGVTNMTHTFSSCSKLTQAPKIPQSVTTMYGAFRFTSIVQAPELPKNVKNIDFIYESCTQLVEVPDIPEGVKCMRYAFWKCTNLEKAPKIPEGVEFMFCAFADCSKLIQAPEIPSTAKYINSVFNNCPNLIGTIRIKSEQIGVESGYGGNPGDKSLLKTGTQGTGLKVIVPNKEVRNLLISNSGYDPSKVEIVESE